ncbi:MAG: beta-propeller domain-containing protein [Nitrosotalea sp.]
MEKIRLSVLIFSVVTAVVISSIIGILVLNSSSSSVQSQDYRTGSGIIPYTPLPPPSPGLKKFNSTDELRSFLLDANARVAQDSAMQGGATFGGEQLAVHVPPAMTPPGVQLAPTSMQAAVTNSAPTANTATANQGPDYSTTNIQVAGVDEPDFLKNDGKFAYILSGDKLTIIEAYPGETARIISKVGLDVNDQSLQNMFLNNDRLVIFYTGNDQQYSIQKYDYMPTPVSTTTTHAIVIDVSNKEDPKIIKDYQVDGSYYDARMIGSFVYFISTSNADYTHPIPPVVRESSKVLMSPPVYYYDSPEPSYNFDTITSFDVFGNKITSQTFLLGATGTLYVSNNALYMAHQEYYPYYYDASAKDRFFKAIVPVLPDDLKNQITSIDNRPDLDSDSKWAQISDLLQKSYNNMTDSDKSQLYDKIQKSLADYDNNVQQDSQKTVIEKIAIDNGSLKYVAQGEVNGYLLNQYSMDESGTKLRVATTSQYYNPQQGNGQSNNVYVLDQSLNVVGSLEKIAENEKIYSARFMGDKLYLVTFHNIDPFFVIDLSADTPKILGALKIPGYSSYLQPYDENHIIGIGKEVTQTQYGNSEPLGVKVSLFDVSNVANPVTVDTYDMGGTSSTSDVLSDPKALLFDKEKNILSIPVSSQQYVQPMALGGGAMTNTYGPNNWEGFYIFGVDPSHGFSLKGIVTHYNGTQYYGYGSRSFYINDSLYTVTPGLMKINDLNNISHEVNQIQLDNTGDIIRYLPQ